MPNMEVSSYTNNEWFDIFWQHYPRREGKAGAKRLFMKIVTGKHKDLTAEPREICVGAYWFGLYCQKTARERGFTKLPATWLNNGCWEDELVIEEPKIHGRNSLQDNLTDRSWAD